MSTHHNNPSPHPTTESSHRPPTHARTNDNHNRDSNPTTATTPPTNQGNRSHDRTGGSRAWLGLLVVLGPVVLVSMDGSILFLAMPRISEALTPGADQTLWILDVYGFAVGSLLIAFGNIGDRYGRRRLLMIGAAVFGAGSVMAAFAPNAELLIAARALMGIAGATLLPSALAVLSELFSDARRRAQAIGIFAAVFAAGFAVGPIVGGLLLESGSGGGRSS